MLLLVKFVGYRIETHERLYCCVFTVVAVGVFFFAYGQVAFWMLSASRQAEKVRVSLLSAILKQDIGWFDTHAIGELNTRLTE